MDRDDSNLNQHSSDFCRVNFWKRETDHVLKCVWNRKCTCVIVREIIADIINQKNPYDELRTLFKTHAN